MKTVLVFKTSISDIYTAQKIKPLLDNMMDKGENWNFDLEDCDNILRVEAIKVQAAAIIKNLGNAGYSCSELDD